MTFYELRTYQVSPGRLDDLLARFRDHTIRLLERHGIHSVGYWVLQDGAETLVYIVRHDRDPDEAWADFKDDPEWIQARAESLDEGPLTEGISSMYMAETGLLRR